MPIDVVQFPAPSGFADVVTKIPELPVLGLKATVLFPAHINKAENITSLNLRLLCCKLTMTTEVWAASGWCEPMHSKF